MYLFIVYMTILFPCIFSIEMLSLVLQDDEEEMFAFPVKYVM